MWLFGINGSWEGLKWKVFKVKALTWPRFFLSVFCYIKWIFRFFLSATTKTFLGVFFFWCGKFFHFSLSYFSSFVSLCFFLTFILVPFILILLLIHSSFHIFYWFLRSFSFFFVFFLHFYFSLMWSFIRFLFFFFFYL